MSNIVGESGARGSQEAMIKRLNKCKHLVSEYEKTTKEITEIEKKKSKASSELIAYSTLLHERENYIRSIKNKIPKARSFIKKMEEEEEYRKKVRPYFKKCRSYILNNTKKVFKDDEVKKQIIEMFEYYEDKDIAEYFIEWYKNLNQVMVEEEVDDERIIWLAHAFKMIDCEFIEIFKNIESCGWDYYVIPYEMCIDLGIKPTQHVQNKIEERDEYILECEEENINPYKTWEYEKYESIGDSVYCDPKNGNLIKSLDKSFTQLKKPNNEYDFNIYSKLYFEDEEEIQKIDW